MDRARRRLAVLGSLTVLVVLVLAAQSCSPLQRAARAPSAPPPVNPADFVGAETCKGCHVETSERFAHTRMGRLFLRDPRNDHERLACEGCHGPGKAHAEAPGKGKDSRLVSFMKGDPTPVETRNAICLTCHQKGEHMFWTGSAHEARDVPCTGCHTVMTDLSPRAQLAKPTQLETCGTCHLRQRAQQMRSSHMPLREGKMTCTSCHSPHGSVTPALLKEPSLNDTCYACHAEKRGPFLWEHAPVTDDCTNCHTPHGSTNPSLLKTRVPLLCQQCHTGDHGAQVNSGANLAGGNVSTVNGLQQPGAASPRAQVAARACINCHVLVHGSNHPAGAKFQR